MLDARSSIRSRALEDPKRVYTSLDDKNVQGVYTESRYDTCK
jgi:hypothetical protein